MTEKRVVTGLVAEPTFGNDNQKRSPSQDLSYKGLPSTPTHSIYFHKL